MSTLQNFDRRRITGPDKSLPPVYDSSPSAADPLASPEPAERAHRSPSSVRPIFLQTGLIPSASGSTYLEQSSQKLVCAVYGPRQQPKAAGAGYSDRGTLTVSLKFAPFSSSRRRAPNRDAEDRQLSLRVQAALEPAVRAETFPKAGVDVFLHVLESDGLDALVCGAVLAASTALADAGVELLGLVVGCSAAWVGGRTWLDPSEQEARGARGVMGLTCLPALGTVASVWQTGELGLEEVEQMADECRRACDELHHLAVKVLLESAKKRLGRS
ncbi:ribosomal protein S5 domain 2-like protein [Calocera viscosa TUFC12733]|uniref:Ribosomal protein S5 domain 2-like protein n=1 Tax=Calocera viscosa (strain TUFC12733) TaxID=1330018 RepID=A0A167P6V0_CALVF|nr:ribosomal protein S5 domain 2-like protein [Calocera viscosa TUFC12733]